MTNALLDETMKASDIAAYLREHPEFLSDYPELAKLTMPREQGAVASLATYQLQSAARQERRTGTPLAELIAIAAENES
jgi:uncharacterized protein YigA (DUF484 family)